ncbi:MAG: hypothetical protein AABW79_01185 [Nanoarchaeota archaeon]
MPKKRASTSTSRIEDTLLHNLTELQKVHIHLLERFDKLATNLSQLLALFETAAHSFSTQSPIVNEKDKDFLEKIDRLLEQNKVIAKGLTLVEEKMRERLYGQNTPQQMPPQQVPRPGMESRPFQRI